MQKLYPHQLQNIAAAAHEVNRSFSRLCGDFSHMSWDQMLPNERAIIVAGVIDVAQNEYNAEQAHEAWRARMLADGWQYGKEKDISSKTHPCLCAYADVPFEYQYKDKLFETTVRALVEGLWRIPQ